MREYRPAEAFIESDHGHYHRRAVAGHRIGGRVPQRASFIDYVHHGPGQRKRRMAVANERHVVYRDEISASLRKIVGATAIKVYGIE